MTRRKRKATHEAPARRQVIEELSSDEWCRLDPVRLTKDRIAFELIYERESVIAARAEFLDAVQRAAPEAFSELLAIRANRGGESNGPLLDNWQRRWNLTDEWCALVAFATTHEPSDEPPPYFLYPEMSSSRSFKPVPAPAFDPTRETWANYRKRLSASLDEYRTQSDAAAERQGFKFVKERRSLRKHSIWLACYQCLGASKKLIADVSNEDRAAIQYAVDETAKLIGLKLRPESNSKIRGAAYQKLTEQVRDALLRSRESER